MKYFLMLLIAFLIAGCTAKSFNGMIHDKKVDKKTFVVQENYQELYYRSIGIANECYATGMLTAAIVANGQIYSDLKKAEMSIYLMGGLGKQMHHGATFHAIDNDSTRMTIYSYGGESTVQQLDLQFEGKCRGCDCAE